MEELAKVTKLPTKFREAGTQWEILERFDNWVFLQGQRVEFLGNASDPDARLSKGKMLWYVANVMTDGDAREYVRTHMIDDAIFLDKEAMRGKYLAGIEKLKADRKRSERTAAEAKEANRLTALKAAKIAEAQALRAHLQTELKQIDQASSGIALIFKNIRAKAILQELTTIETYLKNTR